MYQEESTKNYKKHITKMVIIILVVVLFIRLFFIDSITVGTSHMEGALYKGDKVFVDKATYGSRLPITLLSIPFVFDNIGGVKTYSDLIQLPYKRISEARIRRSDIVLFNNPKEFNKPIDKRSMQVSRCVGLPGDTLTKKSAAIFINSVEYVQSPDVIYNYVIGEKESIEILPTDDINMVLSENTVPRRSITRDGNSLKLKMTRFEAYRYNQNADLLPNAVLYDSLVALNYTLIVPFKGMTLRLNEANVALYESAILYDAKDVQKKKISIDKSEVLLNGEKIESYTFNSDFYWILSDNTTERLDSEVFGFIPFSHVVGRVIYIWYASNSRASSFDRFLKRSGHE